jgi:hypothetical protein
MVSNATSGHHLDAPELPISRLGVLCSPTGRRRALGSGNRLRLWNAATACLDTRKCDTDPAAGARPSRV